MKKITSIFKSAALGSKISVETAIKVLEPIDQEREETINLLKRCEKEVGMVLGEDINQHIANMSGRIFNPIDYHYEKPVGDQ